jgi:hypothetical protein
MVLEARYKAEKIWYQFIWEKPKENADVIDYDIHEEITVNASSVFNANNDTTTGMATVIPWVNAPKLLYGTSIIGMAWWWQYAVGTAACADNRVWDGRDEEALPQWTITLTGYTDWKFILSGNDLKVIEWWTYLFNIEQTNYTRTSQTTDYYIRTKVTVNDSVVVDWRVFYWPTAFKWSWPIVVPAWWILKIYWMLRHVSTEVAQSWPWVERNVSMVRIW